MGDGKTLKEEISSWLEKQHLIHLATYGKELWVANIYYLSDAELNIYFITDPASQHGQDMAHSKQVAAAISDGSRRADEPKVGIQLKGEVEILTDLKELTRIAKSWNSKFEKLGGKPIAAESYISGSYKMYCLKPTMIKYYNEELWAEEKVKMWKV